MEKYIEQLLSDIADATENVSLPFIEKELNLEDFITDEEENENAPFAASKNGQASPGKCFHPVKC